MLGKLAWCMSNEGDLRALATPGLGVSEQIIDGHIHNEKDIHIAALNVLKEWRKGQKNSKVAYTNLCEILRREDVNMPYYICTALQ